MSSSAKRKGSRVERWVVNQLQDRGLVAWKTPLSGALGGRWSGDIRIEAGEHVYKVEVKARKNGTGFKVLEDWLGDNHFLVLKRDRQDPMVTMEWKTFQDLLARAGEDDIEVGE